MINSVKIKSTLSVLAFLLMTSQVLIAQNSAVTNTHFALIEAREYIGKGDFEKAGAKLASCIENIEGAITNEKTSTAAKTWNYRGDVYAEIINLPDPSVAGITKEEAVRRASESFEKTVALDDSKRKDYANPAMQNMNKVYALLFNSGIKNIQDANQEEKDSEASKKLLKQSMEDFELAMSLKPDTNAALNAAIASDRLGLYDHSHELYQKMIEMGAKDHYAFVRVSDYQMRKEQYDEALATIEKGIELNKSDKEKLKDLRITEFNIYLKANRLDEAIENVKANLADLPESADASEKAGLYTRLGQLYDQMNSAGTDTEKDYSTLAIDNYKKAIELDPTNLDANYNLGAFYYNTAAGLKKEVDNMSLKDYQTIGKKKEAEAKTMFEKALPFFLKAYEQAPEDNGLKTSIRTIYLQLKNNTEAAKYQ